MRILVWHGWLLEGAGSNVYTARIVDIWRRQGHDVLLLCQESNVDRFPFLDREVGAGELGSTPRDPGGGGALLLRPDIGELLPVFVYDEYEGFRVKTFVDLTSEELDAYLERNVSALRAAARWHGSDVVIAGHALPGPAIAGRALVDVPYVAKIHGSDIEYAMRAQPRYVELAREGLESAAAVVGASRDVLDRLVDLVPSVAGRTRVVSPGVDAERFRPMPRREALLRTAELLDADPGLARGRPPGMGREVAEALRRRDAGALDDLARRYDQTAPDPETPARLRALAAGDGPLVGYLGKLIPQKGVDHLIAALALLDPRPRALVVGFGTFREWLEALAIALDAGDEGAVAFLRERLGVDIRPEEVAAAAGMGDRLTFTGRLDHRYAPRAIAAADVLVVPSILAEAFGMVALEGSAAGALPLVAAHSGLASIAGMLEAEIGEPGLLSYEPGPDAVRNLAAGIRRILAIPGPERERMRERLSALVRTRWTWERTADGLLDAARGPAPS